jgi:hypothetical protein
VAVARDNLLNALEEPMATMRYRDSPADYRPGELEIAMDVHFQGGFPRARSGYGRYIGSMADILTTNDAFGSNLGWCRQPTGNLNIGLLVRDSLASPSLSFWVAGTTPLRIKDLGFAPGNPIAHPLGDFTNVGSQCLMTAAQSYDVNVTNLGGVLAMLWGGMTVGDYATGTITVTRGSQAVVGVGTSFSQAMVGGYLVDGTTRYQVGRVASVTNATHLTLVLPALNAVAGAAYKILTIRPIIPRMAKGRITCGTGSPVVIGARTKWVAGRPHVGTAATETGAIWHLYRAYDLAWIGQVATFDSDLQLTLAANSAVAMANDRYLLVPGNLTIPMDDSSPQTAFRQDQSLGGAAGGLVCEEHQGRLYMANMMDFYGARTPATVWFSDDLDYEAFDLSVADGDNFIVGRSSSSITGMASTTAGLAIFKANELWMLYGDDPVNYQLRKIADIGAADGRSIVNWQGNLVWVSRDGITMFDGTGVRILSDAVVNRKAFNVAAGLIGPTHPQTGMLAGNTYIFYVEGLLQADAVVNGVTRIDTTGGIAGCFDLQTGQFSVFTNMSPHCVCQIPADAQSRAETIWVGGGTALPQRNVNVFAASTLFGGNTNLIAGRWGFASENVAQRDHWRSVSASNVLAPMTTGPHPFLQTRRIAPPENRMAYFKDVWLEYVSDDDTLTIESIWGDYGDRDLSGGRHVDGTLPQGGTYIEAANAQTLQGRVKVMHRGSYIQFKVYPTTDPFVITAGAQWQIFRLMIQTLPMRRVRS